MKRLHHLAIPLALLAISSPALAQEASLEKGILAELNRVRADPHAYAMKLRAYRNLIDADGVRHDPGDPVGKVTFEGTASVDEAIAALEAQAPLPPLEMDSELAKVAQAYAAEQGRTGGFGHVSADGTSMPGRISHGRAMYGAFAETISYGERTAADVVPDRGHRQILFAAGLNYVGIGCGVHVRYEFECVEDYSSMTAPPVLAMAR